MTNVASAVVLAVVVVFAVLAVRRNMKKGAPCECGGSKGGCRGGCSCGCGR